MNWLRRWLLGPAAPPSLTSFPPCPACPSDDFAIGATTLRGKPVVTCLGCGARWYLSGSAWRRPHEKSLPAAWAQVDTLARMEAQQSEIAATVRTRVPGTPELSQHPRRRAANEGFRRPPSPVED